MSKRQSERFFEEEAIKQGSDYQAGVPELLVLPGKI